ncbi:hypothetical protein HDC94_000933 [Leifsonia sp. AK011]|nr:hypothetical protein [Leifsonia sp. AK011]NYF09777.1 hypothetical protein [Leifsonia sp. AK011]
MADDAPPPADVPPPQVDQKAFKEAQFAPRKKGTAQMTNQPKAEK